MRQHIFSACIWLDHFYFTAFCATQMTLTLLSMAWNLVVGLFMATSLSNERFSRSLHIKDHNNGTKRPALDVDIFFCSHPDKHAKVKSKRQPQSSRRGSFGTSTRKETLLAHLIIRRLLWQNIAVVQPSHFLIHAPFSFVLNFFRSLTVYLRLTDAAREKIATYFF